MAEPERREPLPELHAIPAWLRRRAPHGVRIALLAGVLFAVAGAVALVPGIQAARREDDRRRAAERRGAQAARIRALRAEQRPRGAAWPDPFRPAHLPPTSSRSPADARRRGAQDPPGRPETPFLRRPAARELPALPARRRRPRGSAAAHRALRLPRRDRRHPAQREQRGGHPYRLLIDCGNGRYAFCKISGVPGRAHFRAKRPVTVPEACGG